MGIIEQRKLHAVVNRPRVVAKARLGVRMRGIAFSDDATIDSIVDAPRHEDFRYRYWALSTVNGH